MQQKLNCRPRARAGAPAARHCILGVFYTVFAMADDAVSAKHGKKKIIADVVFCGYRVRACSRTSTNRPSASLRQSPRSACLGGQDSPHCIPLPVEHDRRSSLALGLTQLVPAPPRSAQRPAKVQGAPMKESRDHPSWRSASLERTGFSRRSPQPTANPAEQYRAERTGFARVPSEGVLGPPA